MTLQFEARKIALKQDKTGFTLALSIHPDELPDALFRDWVGARYMCVMVRLQDDESPTKYDTRVTRAGILCRDVSFQKFMSDVYLAEAQNEEASADQLCKQCGITSRTELNGNHLAQALFDELVREYELKLGDEF